MNNADRYTKVAITLHWLIAIAILFLFVLGWYMNELPRAGDKTTSIDFFDLGAYTLHITEAVTPRTFYFNLHKSIGFTVLLLVGLRLYWRLMHHSPALPDSMKRWEKVLAHGTHHLLYLMMVLMPATGLLTTLYSKYGLHWFSVPVLPGLDNPGWRDFFVQAHELSATVLIILIVLHIAAALKHQFIDKDDILKRMSFFH